jgi:DNA-binding NarL/FixJ family response regulator
VSTIGALIVDDEEDIRLMVRSVIALANRGLFVKGEAASGQEVLDSIDEIDPQVVVLDEMMPGLSGLETAERILERRPEQRMILYSAYLDDAMRARAHAVGVYECVAKHEVDRLPDTLRRAGGCGTPE